MGTTVDVVDFLEISSVRLLLASSRENVQRVRQLVLICETVSILVLVRPVLLL